jgi:hypothetical protein
MRLRPGELRVALQRGTLPRARGKTKWPPECRSPLRDGRGPRRGAKRRAPEVALPLASILTVETTPESVAAEKEDPA